MKHGLRPTIDVEKQLAGPVIWVGQNQGISKVGQTILARLMNFQIWQQLASSVALCGEGSEKGQWLLFT